MSITHCDNFAIYGGNPGYMLDGVYNQVHGGVVADPSGAPGYVFETDNTAQVTFLPVPDLVATNGIALRFYATSLPSNTQIGWFSDVGANTRLFFNFTASGRVQVFTANEGGDVLTLLGTSAGPVITANAWWHIEAKAVFSLTVGTIEIRVEGREVLTLTRINTAIAQPYNVGWGNAHSNPVYIKDLVIWDGAGTQNNDFLGSVIVASLIPDADIDFTWSPTPGTDPGYTILATTPPQDGMTYLDAPHPAPAPYVCSMTGLTGDITSVKCVMTMVRAAKTDGGDGSLQIGLISHPSAGPVIGLGADRPITTAQTYWRDVFEIDPKTSAAWLPSSVDIVQLQINRTT